MKKSLEILSTAFICLSLIICLSVPAQASYGDPGSIQLVSGPCSATGSSSIAIRSGNSSTSSQNGTIGLYVNATYTYNENVYKPGATITVKTVSGMASNQYLAYKGFSAGNYDQSISIVANHSTSWGEYEAHGVTRYYYD